jgi:hypothetical protein
MAPVSDFQRGLRHAVVGALREGFFVIDLPVTPDASELGHLLKRYGSVLTARMQRPGIEVIRPTTQIDAAPHSLSRLYGEGIFPFHTDGAHWLTPPRLMVLLCVKDDQHRPTLLLPSSILKTIETHLKDAVFLVKTGRRSFYASPVLPMGFPNIRLDCDCMIPMNAQAREVVSRISAVDLHSAQWVEWKPGRILVVDNWRILHGRAGSVADGDRQLLRALVTPRHNERILC